MLQGLMGRRAALCGWSLLGSWLLRGRGTVDQVLSNEQLLLLAVHGADVVSEQLHEAVAGHARREDVFVELEVEREAVVRHGQVQVRLADSAHVADERFLGVEQHVAAAVLARKVEEVGVVRHAFVERAQSVAARAQHLHLRRAHVLDVAEETLAASLHLRDDFRHELLDLTFHLQRQT